MIIQRFNCWSALLLLCCSLHHDSGILTLPLILCNITFLMFVFLCLVEFSHLLYPALSLLAVGGVLLLITNMQVTTPVEMFLCS